MSDLTIRVDDLIRFRPCYTGEKRDQLIGLFRSRPVWTALDIAALTQYSLRDRLWLMLRPELIHRRVLHELACDFAERALENERAAGREPDQRSWAASVAKRRWLAGEISDPDLDAAMLAAKAAVLAARSDAAADAADAARAAAVYADARAAVMAASESAYAASESALEAEEDVECEWQLLRTMDLISSGDLQHGHT